MNKIKKLILPLALIAVIYLIFHLIGIGCPIKFMTGISCPGCGMSRACISLLRLDFAAAFGFHPLFWIVPAFPLLYILKEAGKLPKKPYDICIGVICVLFLVVWLYRMLFEGGDIVVFKPHESIFFRILEVLKNA